MPIELNGLTKYAGDATYSSFIGKYIINNFTLAFIISSIMVILIMICYPAKSGTSFIIIIKIFIYSYLFNVFILHLHDNIIKNNNNIEKEFPTDNYYPNKPLPVRPGPVNNNEKINNVTMEKEIEEEIENAQNIPKLPDIVPQISKLPTKYPPVQGGNPYEI